MFRNLETEEHGTMVYRKDCETVGWSTVQWPELLRASVKRQDRACSTLAQVSVSSGSMSILLTEALDLHAVLWSAESETTASASSASPSRSPPRPAPYPKFDHGPYWSCFLGCLGFRLCYRTRTSNEQIVASAALAPTFQCRPITPSPLQVGLPIISRCFSFHFLLDASGLGVVEALQAAKADIRYPKAGRLGPWRGMRPCSSRSSTRRALFQPSRLDRRINLIPCPLLSSAVWC
ncbi:hypothetical protein EV356DRAFT_131503 [Viridothelium virens]|uniref:Uncharacterized protein n=1 Tax=Viridothelium virens TaxID=1048519 RepID=A0A6A6HCK2_VIRVR|nr:hypothetical protein EV356DRAFT_131503 [Viridothelium virens]